MEFPRFLLQSIEFSSVTEARASNDYKPDLTNGNWRIGTTAMFLWNIGIAPYKAGFITTND